MTDEHSPPKGKPSSALTGPSVDSSDAAPGDVRVPGYDVLGVLGKGGFGIVYEAEQTTPMRRRVALKVIRPGMDSEQVLARFEAERQALALMSHPNVATIFDAGLTEDDRPYFAMEIVRGPPITEYCDNERLSTNERIKLFLPACEAIQHAHQKGVIHRDIKPSNLLIDIQIGEPMVKVIDFGVAKAIGQPLTSKALFTAQGQLIGTPEYMSPEQADLGAHDVDTRTDIYSLGVVLYELLVGVLPIDPESLRSAALGEIQRIIREVDPPKPSTRLTSLGEARTVSARNRRTDVGSLMRELRNDLDWITIKAMEKSRARRYDSASELAADLRRHLHHEPIAAGPPGVGYRTLKFLRRHRFAVATTSVVMLALIAGVAGLSVGLARALEAERLAQSRLEEAQREAATRKAVIDFLNDDLLGQASPAETQAETTIREVLDEAAEAITGRFDGQPAVEATIRLTLGRTYTALGAYDEAAAHIERAIFLRDQELGPDHLDTVKATEELALVFINQRRFDQAERILRAALEIRLARQGAAAPETLTTKNDLATLLRIRGRIEEAETLHREVLQVRLDTLGPDNEDTWTSKANLAVVLRQQDKLDEAEALAREVFEARRNMFGPSDPLTLTSAFNLARVLEERGELEEALELYAQSLEYARTRYEPDHPRIASMLVALGVVSMSLDRAADAAAYLDEALAIRISSLGPSAQRTVRSAVRLADAHIAAGTPEQAIPRLSSLYEQITPLPGGAEADARAEVAGAAARACESAGLVDDAELWRRRAALRSDVHGD